MASSGNFCTLNPLAALGGGTPDFGTLSNGNTTVALGDTAFGNIGVTSGKWYWEFVITSSSPTGQAVGWANEQVNSGAELGYNSPSSQTGAQIVYMYLDKSPPEIISDAPKSASSGTDVDYGSTIAQYDIVGIAADFDNDKWYMSIDGSFTDMRSGQNPADGSNPLCSASGGGGLVTIARTAGYVWYPAVGNWAASARTFKVNFGADSSFSGQSSLPGSSANASDANGYGDFYYTPPSGFLALCSANLPISDDIDPAQTDDDYPGKQFGADIFTGNGGTQTIQLGDSFKPDLVIMKNRGTTNSWIVIDSTRGYNKTLKTDDTAAESTNAYVGYGIESDFFDSTGIKANGGGSPGFNASGGNYTVQSWRANGGTTVTNTEGSLDSTVQANTKAGFSIVQTPNFSGSCTQGHGLDKAPEFVIHKLTASGNNWNVWHTGLSGEGYIIRLNTTAAETTGSHFNSTAPTADVFSLGASLAGSGAGICYLWHSVEGFSKFGFYEGNGNADGPFIYTGFRPRLLAIKNIDAADGWVVVDTARETFNPLGEKVLNWEGNYAEYDPANVNMDVLSNGFKLRNTDQKINSSHTFIYMCWGDVPFKYNNTF